MNTEENKQSEELEPSDSLQIISNAVKLGSLKSSQAKQMRAELGVFDSHFTKKRSSLEKRKAARKAQHKARAITQRRGHKGQKVSSGRGK